MSQPILFCVTRLISLMFCPSSDFVSLHTLHSDSKVDSGKGEDRKGEGFPFGGGGVGVVIWGDTLPPHDVDHIGFSNHAGLPPTPLR